MLTERWLPALVPKSKGVPLCAVFKILLSFVKLTFGDYFNNVPCILDGFSISPIFDAGFDITDGQQLAKAIKVSGFNFTPIADNNNQLISNNSRFISV